MEDQITSYNDWVGISADVSKTFGNGWKLDKYTTHPTEKVFTGAETEDDFNDIANSV